MSLASVRWFLWGFRKQCFSFHGVLLKSRSNSRIGNVVVVQSLSHIWLCNPINCSRTGFPVLHRFLEFAQIHVHWISDAVQPSHALSSTSPPVFNLSQYQGLFQWVGCSHQVARVLDLQLQHQSFQWIFNWFPLGVNGLISLLSKALSRVFSNTTFQKHKFFGTQPFLLSSSHIHTWLLEKP